MFFKSFAFFLISLWRRHNCKIHPFTFVFLAIYLYIITNYCNSILKFIRCVSVISPINHKFRFILYFIHVVPLFYIVSYPSIQHWRCIRISIVQSIYFLDFVVNTVFLFPIPLPCYICCFLAKLTSSTNSIYTYTHV